MDPKESIVSLNGLADMVQQFQDYMCNNGNNGIDMTSSTLNSHVMEYRTNMDTNERNIISNELRTETTNKRVRNLLDRDANTTQSPKNRRTRGAFGTKNQNRHRSLIIYNRTYHYRNEVYH